MHAGWWALIVWFAMCAVAFAIGWYADRRMVRNAE